MYFLLLTLEQCLGVEVTLMHGALLRSLLLLCVSDGPRSLQGIL
jgi:hypothetical protein